MRLRNTTRGGRRRWLAWPTWRALVLVLLIVTPWLASGSLWVGIGNGETLDIRIVQGGLTIWRGAEIKEIMQRRKIYPADGIEFGSDWGSFPYELDLRFKIYHDDYAPSRGSVVYVPLLTIVAPLVGAILLWSMWRRQPFPTGHCAFCGYDLRGTTSGRCPECGVSVGSSPGQRVCGPML